MPIEVSPDPQRHKLCLRCKKWHEPEEGRMIYPEATGPIGGIFRKAAILAGDESRMRFMCHRCLKIRRRTKAFIFGAGAIVIAAALLLAKLGVLR